MESNTGSNILKVMTFNIHHGQGIDRRIDLVRQAAVMEEQCAHFVLLQEVDRRTRRSGGVDQVEALAKKAGYEYYAFGKTMGFQGGEYGNAILSKFPLDNAENIILRRAIENRGVLSANADVGESGLCIMTTHFSLCPRLRIKQAEYILNIVKNNDCPTIFGGDLNAGFGARSIVNRHKHIPKEIILLREKLLDAGKNSNCSNKLTCPSKRPLVQHDYIFYKGMGDVLDYKVVDILVSDHRPVVVEIIV